MYDDNDKKNRKNSLFNNIKTCKSKVLKSQIISTKFLQYPVTIIQ